MNIEKYPFVISYLYKKVKEEKSYLAKYFFLFDLYNLTVKYLCLLAVSSAETGSFPQGRQYAEKGLNYKTIQKLLKNSRPKGTGAGVKTYNNYLTLIVRATEVLKEQKKIFVKELVSLTDTLAWKLINELEQLKQQEYSKKTSGENYYRKNYEPLLAKVESLLDSLSFLSRYKLIIPYISGSDTAFISLTGYTPYFIKRAESGNIDHLFNFFLMNPENEELLELKVRFFNVNQTVDYNSEPSEIIQKLLNSLHEFLTGSYFRTHFYFPEADFSSINTLSEKVENEDPVIPRPYISSHIDRFLSHKSSGYLFISGVFGSGRTTALKNYIINLKEKNYSYTTVRKGKPFSGNIKEIYEQLAGRYSINKNRPFHGKADEFINVINIVSEFKKQEILIIEDIDLLTESWNFISQLPEKLPENIYFIFTFSPREALSIPVLKDAEIYEIPYLNRDEVKNLTEKLSGVPPSGELTEKIAAETYSLPLYIKTMVYELYREKSSFAASVKLSLKKQINNALLSLQKNESRNINLPKTFMGVLAVSREGFNKYELQQIFPQMPLKNIDRYLNKFGSLLVNKDGRFMFAGVLTGEIFLKQLKQQQVKDAHLKIISFFEPWDKKVTSLSLKYLPYHLLKAGKAESLKKLLNSQFLKSKFKIYPNETLSDLRELITYFVENQPANLADITRFSFLYQNLKEEIKKELINIIEYCNPSRYPVALQKVEQINKPMEKFFQFLIICTLLTENKALPEAREVLRQMLLIPEVYINEYNSELIFTICGNIANNGIFDVINLPRSREDAVNLIRSFTESPYTYKLTEVMLNLIDAVPNETDKTVILESLIIKTAEFSNPETVSKFLLKVIPVIEKIKNPALADKLYYAYISTFLRKPVLYNNFLAVVLAKKDKIKTSLFKYLYYGNLSLLFIHLKEEKISKDFIFKAFDIIEEIDAKLHPFVFNSIFASLGQFGRQEYYQSLVQKLFSCIAKLPGGYAKADYSLRLLKILETYHDERKVLKELVNIITSTEENVTALLFPLLLRINTLKDGRVRNPLVKALLNTANKGGQYKITLYASVLTCIENYRSEKEIMQQLKEMLQSGIQDIGKDVAFETVMDILWLSEEEKLSSELFSFLLSRMSFANDTITFSKLLAKALNTINREKKFKNTEGLIRSIVDMTDTLPESKEKAEVMNYISITYINTGNKEKAFAILHKSLARLATESDENKVYTLGATLNNLKSLTNENYTYDYIVDLLTGIFNLLTYIEKEDLRVTVISDIFNSLVRIPGFPLKNIFYKVLDITNKFTTSIHREAAIRIIRYNLGKIKDKQYITDILQKSVLVSEENFSQIKIKLLSLISIAYLNAQSKNTSGAKKIFYLILSEIKKISYEEYLMEVITYFAAILSRMDDKKLVLELFYELITTDEFIATDKYLNQCYTELSRQLTKVGDQKTILPFYELLLERSSKIKNESIRVDFLTKIVSFITNFGLDKEIQSVLDNIMALRLTITQETNLAVFYRSLVISLNKLNTKEILPYFDLMESSVLRFSTAALKSELLSILAAFYYKYSEAEKSKILFKEAIEAIYEISGDSNQIDSALNLSLRLITTGNFGSAKSIIEFLCILIENTKDEKERFEQTTKFINRFNQLNSFHNEKKYLNEKFSSLMHFSSDLYNIKLFIMLGQIYHKLKEDELMNDYFEKARELINSLPVTTDNIELIISFGIILVQSGQSKEGNTILRKGLVLLKSRPVKVYAELAVKFFASLTQLGELLYEKEIMKELLELLEETGIRELKENDLVTLGYTYASKNHTEKFFRIINQIKSKPLKERLIKSSTVLFAEREDLATLTEILPYILDDSRLFDYTLANILLLSNDPKQIKKITDLVID